MPDDRHSEGFDGLTQEVQSHQRENQNNSSNLIYQQQPSSETTPEPQNTFFANNIVHTDINNNDNNNNNNTVNHNPSSTSTTASASATATASAASSSDDYLLDPDFLSNQELNHDSTFSNPNRVTGGNRDSVWNPSTCSSSSFVVDHSDLNSSNSVTRLTSATSYDSLGGGGAAVSVSQSSDSNVQRPSSTLTTQSAQTLQHSNNSIALSSTPQQSNLSKNFGNILETSVTTIPSLELTPGAHMGHFIHQQDWALESNTTDNSSNHSRNIYCSSSNTSEMWDRGSTPEGKSRDGDDSTVQSTAVLSAGALDVGDAIMSPTSSPRIGPVTGPTTAIIGTPSTVSTAASTEEASLGTDNSSIKGTEASSNGNANHHFPANLVQMEPLTLHRRAPSWDRSPMQHQLYADTEISASMRPRSEQAHWAPQQPQTQQPQTHSPWGTSQVHQSRTASFRNDDDNDTMRAGNYPQPSQQYVRHSPGPYQEQRWHQQLPSQHPSQILPHHAYPVQQARAGVYMQQQQQQLLLNSQGYPSVTAYPHQRKPGYPPQHPLPPSQQASPLRAQRGVVMRAPQGGPNPNKERQVAPNQPIPAGSGGGGGGSRSSSEILKTLLRKKACLYEPDTSRAVALVTWLVGRELALEFGYFSRQQLQAGVHACVAEKIESGVITRTKVNRCMQIILNSCFHYIIPRPDGTEEKGHTFCAQFAKEVTDDSDLLRLLPAPWNNITVNREIVLEASAAEEFESKSEPRSNQASPKGSPALKPMSQSPPLDQQHHHDGGDHDSKRAVLLCFNENVRTAEDAFRCHNEFIRDSAHSSNLQLTAHEWRLFFGKDAASASHIWGNVGIPVVTVESSDGGTQKTDALGQMTPEEAGKFRTSWCAKRYDHDHELCGMAHVEINGGWLRRDPNVYYYHAEFCPRVIKIADKRAASNFFVINECPKGTHCEFAHSREEMIYHPDQYKSTVCGSIMRNGTCRFGDICHLHHPSDSARPAGKKGDRGSRHARSQTQSSTNKNANALPSGAPILYASPAPVSSFEKQLLMPGLQSLYRRQCTVIRAHLRNPKCRCCYNYFGDDAGIDEPISRPKPKGFGLPSSQERM